MVGRATLVHTPWCAQVWEKKMFCYILVIQIMFVLINSSPIRRKGAEHSQFKVNNSKIYKIWIKYLQSIFYSWNRWTVSIAWRAMRRKILETFILNWKNNERLLVSCLITSFPRKYDSLNIEQTRKKQIVKKVIYFLYNRIFDLFNDARRN